VGPATGPQAKVRTSAIMTISLSIERRRACTVDSRGFVQRKRKRKILVRSRPRELSSGILVMRARWVGGVGMAPHSIYLGHPVTCFLATFPRRSGNRVHGRRQISWRYPRKPWRSTSGMLVFVNRTAHRKMVRRCSPGAPAFRPRNTDHARIENSLRQRVWIQARMRRIDRKTNSRAGDRQLP